MTKLHDGLDAFLAGHDEIGEHQIAGRGGEQRTALAALRGLKDDVADIRECAGEHGAERFVVFDDEEAGHEENGAATRRRTPPGEGGGRERTGGKRERRKPSRDEERTTESGGLRLGVSIGRGTMTGQRLLRRALPMSLGRPLPFKR